MPEKTQILPYEGYDAISLQTLSYGSFKQLGWEVKYAVDETLSAYTPRRFNRYENEVSISAEKNQLIITSKLIHGEPFDLLGKNKKNITEFLKALEEIRSCATKEDVEIWNKEIALLKDQTMTTVETEIKNAAETDKVMNFSNCNLFVCYTIIAINVLVFLIMAVSGVKVFNPTPTDILQWGGNMTSVTTTGEWWRLLTNIFVHIGILHLLMNMYGLYFISLFLEPLLGKIRYITAYICSGVVASACSVWWHSHENLVSAGASGAIFGLYGLFLALLTTNAIPKTIRRGLLQSILIFVGYNLLYGLKGEIDNAAHIGGLVTGMGIGYSYFFVVKEPKSRKLSQPVMALVLIGTLLTTFFLTSAAKTKMYERQNIDQFRELMKDLSENNTDSGFTVRFSPPDILSSFISKSISEYGEMGEGFEKFKTLLDKFTPLEEEAIAVFSEPGTGTLKERVERLKTKCLKNWTQGLDWLHAAKSYNLSSFGESIRQDFLEYCDLQREMTELWIGTYSGNDHDYYNKRIEETDKKIRSLAYTIWKSL